ncbi:MULTISPECIES: sigma-70 family RNA polymerase sigma factor [unclassified Sphingopyxis]|uniref:sigma-70 family RNA polymerase sigma factor n=2 Tax=unclassified Sphingopyxis TaxID=2614943 RepID=UPI0007308C09|nr:MULTISPECIES: sigma-70 family RNA polymerase sigma factor [unclassified Sphingopyxis]MBD3732930.1 sigma-70 family RNA polymerase sigma factor [Sphingopyxis sp.]KTE23019.1 RNA polymerase subunit sigma-70 [Sphingopyxis sp. H057]KTE49700.1 RNA polymerase subunit sigma-70 [Sphingopyxis sp. H073]KTE54156.1 RNA polymerase subunit sigma-70 [Sphingopyxis sp. H071]KTE57207.1 RNA polymerase subunit sigma-70 [Sphingopyxis sp. H107]
MKGPVISDVTPSPLDDASFKRELAAMLPHLRAFGRSLTGNADLADDLVQETMLKAWKARASYIPGPSSMKSWAFVILRNCFLSQMRRKKFTADYDELAAERLLVAPDDQNDSLHLADVQRALLLLPVDQREALILIGAGQLSYEEGAEICGCAVGTMKSRVSRARTALHAILEGGDMPLRSDDPLAPSEAFASIMSDIDQLTGGGPSPD